MEKTLIHSNRIEWIDWMKAIGIYLVILGHFYSIGEKFIYAFHVPLFFLISGMLTKKESDRQLFWRKLWYNLVVPMLIMATLNGVYDFLLNLLNGVFTPMDIYWFVRNVSFGMVAGYDALWFVYTLILLKIIFQYSPSYRLFYALTVVMLGLGYAYGHSDQSGFPFFLKEANAIINVCLAFPFFAFGVWAHAYIAVLNNWRNKFLLLLTALCGLVLVVVCAIFNGYVGLYFCNDGGNMLLFLVGGLAGSMVVFAVSKLVGSAPWLVLVVSRGTIVILGFHKLFIALARTYFPASWLDVLFAILIVLLFVPIILLTENYFPLMAGKYRTKIK